MNNTLNNFVFDEDDLLALYRAMFNVQGEIHQRETTDVVIDDERFQIVRDTFEEVQAILEINHNDLVLLDGQHVILDLQHLLYMGSPFHMTETPTRTTISDGSSYNWWTHRHSFLHDGTGPNSFRAHYRINRKCFDFIVSVLKEDPAYVISDSRETSSHPVWKQVAVVLWRLSNTHLGYRMARELLGVTQGSYHRFTSRFLTSMKRCLYRYSIRWPSTVEECRTIMAGFAVPSRETGNEHLRECIGAIDGKLVVVQKPSNFGNSWLDRHGNPSMSLMAVCDHKKRFIKIRVGVPGKQLL